LSVTTEHQLAHHQRAEAAALARVIQRLQGQFPELDQTAIELAVRGRHHAFDESPIRDFVPILVDRSARDDLAAKGVPNYRA
jgi:hypothetical protein